MMQAFNQIFICNDDEFEVENSVMFDAENVCIHNKNVWQKGELHAGKCDLANIS